MVLFLAWKDGEMNYSEYVGKASKGAFFVFLGCCLGFSAYAEDEPIAGRTAREELSQKIEQAYTSRREGIAVVVIGGFLLGGGILATLSSAETEYNSETGEEEVDLEFAPMLVGMAIGIPTIVGGTLKVVRSSREVRSLQYRRSRVNASSGGSGFQLVYTVSF
jgi:hypothetical protein